MQGFRGVGAKALLLSNLQLQIGGKIEGRNIIELRSTYRAGTSLVCLHTTVWEQLWVDNGNVNIKFVFRIVDSFSHMKPLFGLFME